MNNCKNCGSTIIFSPKEKANVCVNCGSKFDIKYESWFEKRIYDDKAINPRDEDKSICVLRKIKCKSCGAMVVLDKYHAQSICPYCGDSEIVDIKSKINLLIDSIIPFAFDSQYALEIIKKKVKTSFFADKSILTTLSKDDVYGLYINSYVFDIKSKSSYKGILRDTIRRKDKDGRSYTEIVSIPVSGDIECDLDNITIEANANVNQQEINAILPFDYHASVKYSSDFMNGYILEYPDKALNEIYQDVRNVLENNIKNKIISKHNADSILTIDLNINITDSRYNYSLLPIYFIRVETKKKKKHRVVMNGQTGKINSLPKSGWKIFGFILAIFGGLASIIFIISMIASSIMG